jgi:hypothetical protein
MGPLAVSAFSPLTLSAASALRPLSALPLPATSTSRTSTTLTIPDVAQGVFQRTLQAATLSALTEPAAGSAGLAAEATGSLLAALTAPQAPAESTATPDATTVPAVVQTADSSSAPPSAPPTTVPADAQTTNTISSSQDFALEAALRFGAGVASQVAPTLQAGDLGAGLVREAAAVPRLGNLQPHTGGPGPEAFAQRQASVQRAARGYAASPITQDSGMARQMDILA